MAIVDEGDQFLIYKYKVHQIQFCGLKPEKPTDSSNYELEKERVNDLIIMEDYVGNTYPLIKFSIAIEQSIYYRILESKETVKVLIHLRKYYRKKGLQRKEVESVHINRKFDLILDDNDADLAKNARKEEYPNGDTQRMNAVTVNMTFYLYSNKKVILKAQQTEINKIWKSTTPSHVLTFLLGKLGVGKHVLVSKIDNGKSYAPLIIPKMTLLEALSYVDSYYGYHKTGTLTFFGIDRSYVLCYGKNSGAFEKKEQKTVNVLVPRVGSSITDSICSLRKKKNEDAIYVLADPLSFKPLTPQTSSEALTADGVTTFDNDKMSTSGSGSAAYIQESENPYISQVYDAQLKSEEMGITCTFRDCDEVHFTPNKMYNFIFEDTEYTKKYHAKYFMISKTTTYVKDGKDLTVTIEGEFRKLLT